MLKTYKRIVLSIFLLLLSIGVSMALGNETNDGRIRVGIAIYAGRANGLNADDARIITNMLTNALAGTPNIRLYERQQLDAVMRELQRSHHTLMDENTIVELGRVAGLQYVLVGAIDSLGRVEHRSDRALRRLTRIDGDIRSVTERLEVNIRILCVATGEVRYAFAETGTAQELNTRMHGSSTRISGDIRTRAIRDAVQRLSPAIRDTLMYI